MKLLWRTYCFLCGMLVGPAVMAAALAWTIGAMPAQRVELAFATLTGEVDPTPAPEAVEVTKPVLPELDHAPLEDIPVWERRLERLRSGIDANVEDLGREIASYKQEEVELEQLRDALSALLSVQLGQEIPPTKMVAESDRYVKELTRKRSDAEKLPRLLDTLQTVEPQSLAVILAGKDGSPGLEEQQSVLILSRFPPRKAGAVLSEVGELDPALAARLVDGLGGRQPDKVGNP